LTKTTKIEDAKKESSTLEEDPAWKKLEKPKHWGIKDSSKRIDEFLYGR